VLVSYDCKDALKGSLKKRKAKKIERTALQNESTARWTVDGKEGIDPHDPPKKYTGTICLRREKKHNRGSGRTKETDYAGHSISKKEEIVRVKEFLFRGGLRIKMLRCLGWRVGVEEKGSRLDRR